MELEVTLEMGMKMDIDLIGGTHGRVSTRNNKTKEEKEKAIIHNLDYATKIEIVYVHNLYTYIMGGQVSFNTTHMETSNL